MGGSLEDPQVTIAFKTKSWSSMTWMIWDPYVKTESSLNSLSFTTARTSAMVSLSSPTLGMRRVVGGCDIGWIDI